MKIGGASFSLCIEQVKILDSKPAKFASWKTVHFTF